MNRFWNRYISLILRDAMPKRIVEIGADLGWNTQHLLKFCRETQAFCDIVDTKPSASLLGVLEEYGHVEYRLHVEKSIDAIPKLISPDIVMLDGDHNWRTVYSELSLFWS